MSMHSDKAASERLIFWTENASDVNESKLFIQGICDCSVIGSLEVLV